MKALRVITLFSGYDSQALALNRLGIPYDLVAWAEIDKHACTAHDALFPQFKGRNVGDVSKVDWAEWHRQHPEPIDLLTYSSPCQDFSSAGLQRGGEEGSGTRSGLLWETERAVRELRPRHLVFENVAGLVSDKFIDLFNRWQARLNKYGYTNFQQLMNAKDYGVPQNRLRIFMVSILDCQRAYYFPKPFRLERRLKDVLEQNVDERYYLKDEQIKSLLRFNEDRKSRGMGFQWKPKSEDDVASAVCTMAGQRQTDNYIVEPKVEVIADLQPDSQWQGGVRQQNRVIGINGIAPACTAEHNKHPYKIAEPQINVIGNLYDNNEQAGRIYDSNGISPTLDNIASGGNKSPKIVEPIIASMKSRDKDNPTGVRTANNGNFAQRIEPSADQSTSNTITSVAKDNLLIEPAVLAPVRTEYGKAIRKQYGDNNLPESRHNLTQLQPKQDGTSNTITSVAKDNYLIEPRSKRQESIKAKVMPNGDIRCYRDIPGKPGVSEMQFTHPDNESPTVTCEAQIKVIEPAIIEDFYGTVREPRVYTDEAPTLRADRTGLMTIEHASVAKDNYLIVPEATKEGYAVVPEGGVFDASYPDSKTRRGRVQEGGTVSPTIMAGQNELLRYEGIRIRRLTERELYRLMDVEEKDIDTLLSAPIPRTQHAKLAGNSIVVACLYHIFRNLFVDTEPEVGTQTKLF